MSPIDGGGGREADVLFDDAERGFPQSGGVRRQGCVSGEAPSKPPGDSLRAWRSADGVQ